MASRGIKLTDVPINITRALRLQPGRSYWLQLQGGSEARLFFTDTASAPAPDPLVVDADDAMVAGESEPRPMRLTADNSIEFSPGQGAAYTPTYAFDSGEGWLVVNEIV